MSDNILFHVQSSIEENQRYRFWFWHIGFWFFMGVLGFFTLILWYAEASRESVGHVTVQASLGLVCSLLLHQAFNSLTKFSITLRVVLGFLLILSTSFLWTYMHMQVYVLLTGFEAVWEEFGGWYFSGIFIFLCWTGLFHGIRYYDLMQFEHSIMLKAEANSREEHLKRVRAQSEARDAKLKMLRYQLNPHFLYNSLNAINSLIEIGESAKAQLMTVQLSEFLRYSLDTDPDAKITLLDEIEALNLYLEIEKTRFEERLNIIIQIAPSAQFSLVPSLLLQPLIENSMKYAISKSESGGTISIIANTTKTDLVLIVKDTGNNSVEKTQHNIDKKLVKRKGIGLTNIKQRLSALYQDAYRLNTKFESSGGLTTTIHLPLELENKAG